MRDFHFFLKATWRDDINSNKNPFHLLDGWDWRHAIHNHTNNNLKWDISTVFLLGTDRTNNNLKFDFNFAETSLESSHISGVEGKEWEVTW